jgi:hypothetical protein
MLLGDLLKVLAKVKNLLLGLFMFEMLLVLSPVDFEYVIERFLLDAFVHDPYSLLQFGVAAFKKSFLLHQLFLLVEKIQASFFPSIIYSFL